MQIEYTNPDQPVNAINSQVNIYHNYASPHIPPTVTKNGMPVTAETINHDNFMYIEALKKELENRNEIIELLRDQVNYWQAKYNKLKELL